MTKSEVETKQITHVGFASQASDVVENKLDLNHYLIKHPAATFFVRTKAVSDKDGNNRQSILVIDRALTPVSGNTILAVHNGEFILHKLHKGVDTMYLLSDSPGRSPIKITDSSPLEIWGVVTYSIDAL